MRLKEKLGDKYSQLEDLLKDTGVKASEIDIIDGYVPRKRLNEEKDRLTASENKVKTLETQIKESQELLTKSEKFKEESEEYKKQVLDLSEKHKTELEQRDKELNNVVKKNLVRESLIDGGAKHVDLLMKEISLDEIKVGDDGKLSDFDKTIDKLKETYKNDMFVIKENKQDIETGGVGENDNPFGDNGDFSFLDNIKS